MTWMPEESRGGRSPRRSGLAGMTTPEHAAAVRSLPPIRERVRTPGRAPRAGPRWRGLTADPNLHDGPDRAPGWCTTGGRCLPAGRQAHDLIREDNSTGADCHVPSAAAARLIAEFARRHIACGADRGRIIGLISGGDRGVPEQVCYGAARATRVNTMSAVLELAPSSRSADRCSPAGAPANQPTHTTGDLFVADCGIWGQQGCLGVGGSWAGCPGWAEGRFRWAGAGRCSV
jgi:hypothetical protein